MARKPILAVLAVLICFLRISYSQQKSIPDLTGNWKLDPAKSTLQVPLEYRIKQTKETIDLDIVSDGKQVSHFRYMLNGQRAKAGVDARNTTDLISEAHWEKNDLIVKSSSGNGSLNWTTAFRLAEGQKTLTVSMSGPEIPERVLVFVKQ